MSRYDPIGGSQTWLIQDSGSGWRRGPVRRLGAIGPYVGRGPDELLEATGLGERGSRRAPRGYWPMWGEGSRPAPLSCWPVGGRGLGEFFGAISTWGVGNSGGPLRAIGPCGERGLGWLLKAIGPWGVVFLPPVWQVLDGAGLEGLTLYLEGLAPVHGTAVPQQGPAGALVPVEGRVQVGAEITWVPRHLQGDTAWG